MNFLKKGEIVMTKLKAIFHIDESEKWILLLANVNNLLNDLGEDEVRVIVLANSVAVKEYVVSKDNEEILNKIDELQERGVAFKACRNALAGNKIDENILPKAVKVVSAGVSELIKRQVEGYAYIKP